MYEYLKNDPNFGYRFSTLISDEMLNNNVLDGVESGARKMIEAIALTQAKIRESLESCGDMEKVMEAIGGVERQLAGIEARLASIEGRLPAGAASAEAPAQAPKKKKERPPERSIIVFDVMPADTDVDLADLERRIKDIHLDSLIWGECAVEEVGFGIRKIRVACEIEDEKCNTDDIESRIADMEDFVQSVQITAFQKAL